jgi:hypothetical protein
LNVRQVITASEATKYIARHIIVGKARNHINILLLTFMSLRDICGPRFRPCAHLLIW